MKENKCVESKYLTVPHIGLNMIVKFQDDPLLSRVSK